MFWHFRVVLEAGETDLEILQPLIQFHLWLFPQRHVKLEYWLNQSAHFSENCGTLTGLGKIIDWIWRGDELFAHKSHR